MSSPPNRNLRDIIDECYCSLNEKQLDKLVEFHKDQEQDLLDCFDNYDGESSWRDYRNSTMCVILRDAPEGFLDGVS